MLFDKIFIAKIVISLSFESKGQQIVSHTLEVGSVYGRIDPKDEEIWSAAYCVRKFLKYFLHRSEETPLYLATGGQMSSRADLIFRTLLDGELSAYLLSGDLSYDAAYSSSLDALILAENSTMLLKNSHPDLSLLCSRRCATFVVVFSHSYEEADEFLADVQLLVKELWKWKIANVAFAGEVDGLYLFGKSEFLTAPGKVCTPANPEVLGACSVDSPEGRRMSKSIFSNIRPKSCLMNAFYVPRKPYAMISEGGVISGVEGRIMNAMSAALHFQCKSKVVRRGRDYSSVTENLDKLFIEEVNISFVYGGILWKPRKNVDFTHPYDVTQIVWILPVKPQISILALFSPMSSEVWIVLLVLFVISMAIIPIFYPKHDGLMEMAGLLLGTSVASEPSSFSHKIFFISWALMGFIITQYYLASLAKNLLTDTSTRIDSVKDLISSKLKLVADMELIWVYASSGKKNEYEYDSIIKSRLVYVSQVEIARIKADLMAGKIQDTAILIARDFSSAKIDLGANVHQMQEITGSYPLAFAAWRGMPVLKAIDGAISRLIETGHVARWATEFSNLGIVHSDTNDHNNLVGLTQLFPAFLLLLFGYALASGTLVLEIIVKKRRSLRCSLRVNKFKRTRIQIR